MRPQATTLPFRCGVSLVELAAALVILSAVAAACVKGVTAVAAQRRATEQRMLAVESLSNQMERFTARPLEEITQQAAEQLSLSETTASQLAGAALAATVTDVAAPDGKRITMTLTWQRERGGSRTVRLTSWRYR